MRPFGSLFVQRFRTVVIVAICGLAVGACGKKGGEQPVASKGQVVAHVGNQVVTTQELENEFRWDNIPANNRSDPDTVKKVLGELVLRKYLLQEALNSKLDREPGVLLDILRSREQVLASAFLTRKVASQSVSQADVDKYIAKNPLKFARRKILTIDQIAFRMAPNSEAIIDANKGAKTLDEVDQRLTSAGVAHARQMGTLNSAEIPQDVATAVETGKRDGVFFVRSGVSGVFFEIKGAEPRHLEGEAAADMARQFLRAEALKAEAELARMSANLDAKFEGEYARIMAEQGTAAAGAKK